MIPYASTVHSVDFQRFALYSTCNPHPIISNGKLHRSSSVDFSMHGFEIFAVCTDFGFGSQDLD